MEYHSYLQQQGISISAHRGGSLEAPENTLEAFKYSLDLGFVMPVVEIDGQTLGAGMPGPIAARLREIYLEESLKQAI